jgi:hypothetical protein
LSRLADLVQRLRALKAQGSRLFEFGRHLQLARHRAANAEQEALCARALLADTEARLRRAHEALEVKRHDPLAEARVLLEAANDLFNHSPVTMAEVRSWRAEYLVYRQRHGCRSDAY